MSEEPERIVPSCVEALESYQQADMEGVMVLASRQAIHETIDAYWARVKTCEELEAKLAKALVRLSQIRKYCANRSRGVPSIDTLIIERCKRTSAKALKELKAQDNE